MAISGDVSTILSSAVRLSVPLAFAATGEYVAERAGTLNISVEAMMLAGAFFGVWGTSATGSVGFGLLIGVGAGLVVGIVQANLSHRLTANPFVVGLTLNVLVVGLTSYLFQSWKITPHQAGIYTVPVLNHIPVVGKPLFEERWPAFILIVLVPFVWWLVQRSRFGLEVRAVGERPEAADVSGIEVDKRRRQSVYFCGAMAGMGGAYLAVAEVGLFNQNMTAGRGFIAIAAVIFGGWTLRGTILGCFLFGGADALRLALPSLGVVITPELLIAAPYILAIVAMLFFARRSRQPAALGQPFVRGVV
jgi:general nucleoside transport system permease protein